MKSDKKEKLQERARLARIAREEGLPTLPVWYAHPDGFLDPRDPSPRIAVGPILSRINGETVITSGMTTEEVGAIRRYRYQQLQIGN